MISIHKTLFNSLDKILNKADRLKYDQHFVTHESSDFTRKSRKLSFKDVYKRQVIREQILILIAEKLLHMRKNSLHL